MADTFRDLCAELVDIIRAHANPDDYAVGYVAEVLARADASLAKADGSAVPDGREPTRDELWELWLRLNNEMPDRPAAVAEFWEHARVHTRALCGNPAPAPPADGEVAELAAALQSQAIQCTCDRLTSGDLRRAAELLQRQALVPVAVSDALIKAECALADIAEGEPMADEGDLLQWAERRCADTLAIIRPTMRQHKIRTSEWPPVPAHALPLPEVGE